MEFSEIEKIVFKSRNFPKNAGKDELFALFALKGVQAYFRDGDVNKPEATAYKTQIDEWLTSSKHPRGADVENEWYQRVVQAEEIQSKILLANLLHCNPYTLMLQACKIVSILLGDSMQFYNQMCTDCRDVVGMGLDDPLLLDAEREQLRADIERLEEKINNSQDAQRNYRLRRAQETMQTRLDAITPPEKNKNPFE